MKIWNSYGSEHSENLVMIGRFVDENAAKQAAKDLDKIVEQAMKDMESGHIDYFSNADTFSSEMLELVNRLDAHRIGTNDIADFISDHRIHQEGNTITVKTEETEVFGLMKFLYSRRARIELYSSHWDHVPDAEQVAENETDTAGDEDA